MYWISEEQKRKLFDRSLLDYLKICKDFENCYSKLKKIPWINDLEKDSLNSYYNKLNHSKDIKKKY